MRPIRFLVIVAVAAVLIAIVGLAIFGRGDRDPVAPIGLGTVSVPDADTPLVAGPVGDPASPEDEVPLPELVLESVAAVFTHDEAGARNAAVAFLELTEQAVKMTPVEAAEMGRPFSTAAYADEGAARTKHQMMELLAAVPNGIKLRLAPMEVRSVPAGDGWTVSIWFVEAITVGNEAVVDDWRTATYQLAWEHGAWKVAGFESERGPMPGRGSIPASATPVQFEALLAGFSDAGLYR